MAGLRSLKTTVISQVTSVFINTPLRRSAFESIITGFLAQLILAVSGILTARILGVEGRGYFALLTLFPVLLVQIASLGLPQAVTHYVAANHSHAYQIFRKLSPVILIQNIVIIIVHGFVIWLYVQDKSSDISMSGYISIVVGPGLLALVFGLAFLQGLGKFRSFNFLRVMPVAVFAILMTLIFFTDSKLLYPVTGAWSLVQITIGAFILNTAVKQVRAFGRHTKDSNVPSLKKMFDFGIKGVLGHASPLENFRIDQLIVGLYLAPKALGFYVVAQAFVNLPKFVAVNAGMVEFPALSAMRDKSSAKHTVMRFFMVVVILNLIITIPLMFFMPVLIEIFFGDDFTPAASIARILLLGAFVHSARRILVEGLRGLGRPTASTYAELSMYPALAMLIPILVTFYEAEGMAIALAIGQGISLIVAVILTKKALHERV